MKSIILVLSCAAVVFAFPQKFAKYNVGPAPKRLDIPNAHPLSAQQFDDELITPQVSKLPRNYVPNAYEKEQNLHAMYEFMSDVDDHISDLTQQRSETRDGLKVRGMYSYSDGYYKRTVHYEADEKGYRVTAMEAEPLGGPQIDLSGTASVSSAAHGTHVAYRVQSVPVEGPVAKIIDKA